MMIYKYDIFHIYSIIIIFLIMIIAMILGIVALVLYTNKKGIEVYDNVVLLYKNWPWQLKLIFRYIPICILSVFAFLLVFQVYSYANFVYSMENDNGIVLSGKIQVESISEDYYRDVVLGKNIIISIDGVTITPQNSFSDNVIENLYKAENVSIAYGFLGEDLIIWSIKNQS